MHTIISTGYKGYTAPETLSKLGYLPSRVEILCDTAADLPTREEIETNGYTPGSIALIADEHAYKILNHAKEWV